jgi:hypothetical protein
MVGERRAFRHVQLAEDDGARLPQTRDHDRIAGREVVLEDVGAAGRIAWPNIPSQLAIEHDRHSCCRNAQNCNAGKLNVDIALCDPHRSR